MATVNNPHTPAPIIVGADGSDASWSAVLTATWEARQRQTSMKLIHGYLERVPYAPYGWAPYTSEYDGLKDARTMLERVTVQAREQHPDLTVDSEVQSGTGAGVLVEQSRQASMVVLGARGHGGFAGLSIGSVAAQVAAHAKCPVLVVRPDVDGGATIPTAGPVLVGVDGSPRSDAALAFAFVEASLRSVPLIATHVWWMLPRDNLGPVYPGTYDDTAAHTEAQRILAEAVAGWSPKYPDVAVELRPVHSMNPSASLIDASEGAGLVVVGCRGRGGFTGLLLGSVSRDLVGHAHCPVAVVHDHS